MAVICREQYKMKVETTITATSFESMTVLVTVASYTLRLIVIYRIPPSQQNKLAKSTFLTQFTDLVEHASTWSGKLVIVGDFNVHWDKSHDRERQQLSSLFETFNLVQHVTTATHTEGHILDLIVTCQEEDLVASCGVGDFISDHRAILVQLNCGKSHPIRKIVSFRKIKSLNSALLEHDIMTSDLHNAELDNVDDAVAAYNTLLCGLLDKYAPRQTRSVAERPPTSWISADILQGSFKLSVNAAEVNEFGGSQV